MMTVSKHIFLLLLMSTFAMLHAEEKVVVGYYPTYRHDPLPADQLQLQHLTHVNHCFISQTEKGDISYPDNLIYPELVQRVHDAGKKIYISAGGGAQSGGFDKMAADATARATFISNVVTFCRQHGYDGLDVDWEHPANNVDKASMNKLVSEFKQTAPDLGITVTLPGGDWVGRYIDYAYLTPLVDWFNIMCYDASGPWSATSGHHSPIYARSGSASVVNDLNYLLKTRRIPADKLVLGIPFYGHEFNSTALGAANSGGTSWGYSEIMKKINDGWDYYWDDYAKSPYLVNKSAAQIISYNNMETIALKCDYALKQGLHGVMIWEISHDYLNGEQPLLEMTALKMLKPAGQLTASIKITQPLMNAQILYGETILISAQAGDSVSSVAKVEFYIDSIIIGQDDTAPYELQYVWQDSLEGYRSLKALAYSSTGVATPSERVYLRAAGMAKIQTPYNGIALAVPGKIEAEDFDDGGEAISWHDSTPGNAGGSYRPDLDVDIEPCSEGGYNLGYLTDGEWLEYTINVDNGGLYDIDFRVAGLESAGTFHLEVDSLDVTGPLTAPVTGGWQAWVTVSAAAINITSGPHLLRFCVDKAGFNFNNMIISSHSTGIGEDLLVGRQFRLMQNYPNPFNPSTTIGFAIPADDYVKIGIYNVNGQLVKTLLDRKMPAGNHELIFDAGNLAAGIYLYKINTGKYAESKKMVLLE